MSEVNAADFHPMRGHVADGTVVRFRSGLTAVVRSAIRGWSLVVSGETIGMFDSALELTQAIVQADNLGGQP